MNRLQKLSVLLLVISAVTGLVRGYRMTRYPEAGSLLYPYPPEVMQNMLFSSFAVMGWVLFFLVGVFSVVVIVSLFRNFRYYAYLIIIEGIFVCFFTFTNILLTSFTPMHFVLLPICIATIVLGVLQTPKEF